MGSRLPRPRTLGMSPRWLGSVLMVLLFNPVTSVINIPGDVTIVGLFSIHDSDSGQCGSQINVESVMTAEAVKWYIQNLNKHADLPLTIGFKAYETCRVDAIASEIAIDVMNQALTGTKIVGILGPEFSSEAEQIAPILSSVSAEKMLVQVGFSTTATRLLSTPGQYPNFVRVVPNDGIQIETMVQAMLELQWNRIAVLYEDDTYGYDGAHLLKERVEVESICVSYMKSISVSGGVNIQEINEFLNDIIIGEEMRPSIGGIVFIGSTGTARAIFTSMQGLKIAPLPIVMLSEGVNLNANVFKQNGNLLTKSKGSLVLSPPYTSITEFTQHWTNIFTNATTYASEIQTNPWLTAVYESVNCLGSCPFEELSESQVMSIFGKQPLYIQYAVRAAHVLVKGIVNSHTKHCSTTVGLCSEFVSNFQTGEMVSNLKDLNIEFATDFKWRLENPPPVFTIDGTGEIITSSTSSTYELYNFRSSETPSEFQLTQIGELIDGQLNLQLEKVRDYTTAGDELLWPDVRKAQCGVGSKCVDCTLVDELYEKTLFIPGNVYIVGLVPVFNSDGKHGCADIRTVSGYQAAESIRFAIQNANTKTGDFDGYFADLTIGIILINTCNNQVVVQRKIFDVFENGVILNNGTNISVKGKIMGVVGALGSSISIAAAEILSRLHFVQISYASTNPTLSDRIKYPYFMRVVTPVDIQAQAMTAVLKQLDVNYVQIIYNLGAYGEGGRDKVNEFAKLNNICVVQEIPVDEKNSQYAIYDQLLEYSHARVVIVFLGSHMVNIIMNTVSKQIDERGQRGEFLFIGSEAWANKLEVLDNVNTMPLLGSYTLSVEMYQDKQLRAYIQTLEPESFTANPWSVQYLQAKRNCYFDLGFDKKTYPEPCSDENDYSSNSDFVLDSWDTAAYVATKTLLMGANVRFQNVCGATSSKLCDEFLDKPQGLVDEILKTKLDLDGSGNKIKVFNTNSDGNVGYRIYNIQKDKDEPQKLVYVPVGRYPLDGTFTFETNKIVFPTTETEFVSKCPNEKACLVCFQPTQDQLTVNSESNTDTTYIGLIVLGALLAIAIIVIVLLVCYAIRKNIFHYADKELYLHPTASSNDTASNGRWPADNYHVPDEFPAAPPCRNQQGCVPDIQTTDT